MCIQREFLYEDLMRVSEEIIFSNICLHVTWVIIFLQTLKRKFKIKKQD